MKTQAWQKLDRNLILKDMWISSESQIFMIGA